MSLDRAFDHTFNSTFDVRRFPPSNVEGLGQLLFHSSAIALSTAVLVVLMISTNALMLLPFMALQGILLVALFAPNHECVHRTVFRTPWLNDTLAWIIGWLLFIPSVDFRYFHFAHHRHTQDPQRDPELASPKPQSRRGYLWALTGVPLYVSTAQWFWRLAFGNMQSDYLPKNKQAKTRRQAQIYLALYAAVIVASLVLQSWLVLVIWLGPFVIAQPVLRAYLLAEHTGCEHSANMYANTRTVLSNPLVRALMWNMPLHSEHHAHPAVPFYALPALHAAVKGRQKELEAGYQQTHASLTSKY